MLKFKRITTEPSKVLETTAPNGIVYRATYYPPMNGQKSYWVVRQSDREEATPGYENDWYCASEKQVRASITAVVVGQMKLRGEDIEEAFRPELRYVARVNDVREQGGYYHVNTTIEIRNRANNLAYDLWRMPHKGGHPLRIESLRLHSQGNSNDPVDKRYLYAIDVQYERGYGVTEDVAKAMAHTITYVNRRMRALDKRTNVFQWAKGDYAKAARYFAMAFGAKEFAIGQQLVSLDIGEKMIRAMVDRWQQNG